MVFQDRKKFNNRACYGMRCGFAFHSEGEYCIVEFFHSWDSRNDEEGSTKKFRVWRLKKLFGRWRWSTSVWKSRATTG